MRAHRLTTETGCLHRVGAGIAGPRRLPNIALEIFFLTKFRDVVRGLTINKPFPFCDMVNTTGFPSIVKHLSIAIP